MVQIAGTQERWSTHSLARISPSLPWWTDGWMDATDREEKRRGGGRRAMTDGRGRVLDQLLLMAPSSRSTDDTTMTAAASSPPRESHLSPHQNFGSHLTRIVH